MEHEAVLPLTPGSSLLEPGVLGVHSNVPVNAKAIRRVQYFPGTVTSSAVNTHTTDNNLVPDYWLLLVLEAGKAETITFKEVNRPGIPIPFAVTEVTHLKLSFPGHDWQVTIANSTANSTGYILAAIWGFEPCEVL